jgi:ATP-dependent DNA ligase
MAAQSVAELSEREGWIYELKLDGYRALLLKDRARVHIRSRNNKDLTACIRELRRLGCG